MLPIIGPTPDRGQSANIQQQKSDGQENPEETDQEGQTDRNTRGVKLDLGQSNQEGVHRKTAQMVLETKVKVSVKRSVSISTSSTSVNNPSNASATPAEDVNPDETAKRIADFVESIFDEVKTDSSENEDDARQAFLDNAEQAIDKGFEEARKEVGNDPSDAIEKLFQEVRTALDEYLEVFGEGTGAAESNDSTSAEQAVAEQNANAQNSTSNIPTNLTDGLLDGTGSTEINESTTAEQAVAEQNASAQNGASGIPTNLTEGISATNPQTVTNLVGS